MATKATPKLTHDAVSQLRRIIREYESDTFSASGAELTEEELEQIAASLISEIEDHLDGIAISSILDEIREQ